MKTAIKELIEWIEKRFNNPHKTQPYKKAFELLEKEKEQIMKAYNDKIGRCNEPYLNGLHYYDDL